MTTLLAAIFLWASKHVTPEEFCSNLTLYILYYRLYCISLRYLVTIGGTWFHWPLTAALAHFPPSPRSPLQTCHCLFAHKMSLDFFPCSLCSPVFNLHHPSRFSGYPNTWSWFFLSLCLIPSFVTSPSSDCPLMVLFLLLGVSCVPVFAC